MYHCSAPGIDFEGGFSSQAAFHGRDGKSLPVLKKGPSSFLAPVAMPGAPSSVLERRTWIFLAENLMTQESQQEEMLLAEALRTAKAAEVEVQVGTKLAQLAVGWGSVRHGFWLFLFGRSGSSCWLHSKCS